MNAAHSRTEAASYAVNGEGWTQKKRNICRSVEHLEDNVQLYEDM